MIREFYGDIFDSGADVIVHQVNCQGVMGSGIAFQVKERFPEVYKEYKLRCDSYPNSMKNELLGQCLLVHTNTNQIIANLFAQLHYGRKGIYTDYLKFEECLRNLKNELERFENKIWKVAFPYKIGSARGGGNWERIKGLIELYFKDSQNINIEIWRFDNG